MMGIAVGGAFRAAGSRPPQLPAVHRATYAVIRIGSVLIWS
jgi:hypothetical protein